MNKELNKCEPTYNFTNDGSYVFGDISLIKGPIKDSSKRERGRYPYPREVEFFKGSLKLNSGLRDEPHVEIRLYKDVQMKKRVLNNDITFDHVFINIDELVKHRIRDRELRKDVLMHWGTYV
jgi:hypothetical protein